MKRDKEKKKKNKYKIFPILVKKKINIDSYFREPYQVKMVNFSIKHDE